MENSQLLISRGFDSRRDRWVVGYYGHNTIADKHYILTHHETNDLSQLSPFNYWTVDPDTVGLYTGFQDTKGKRIFGGDQIGDWVPTDEGMIRSKRQVFWCSGKGAWMLDCTSSQNKGYGELLSRELADFEYEIVGNIYNLMFTE